MSEKNKNLSAFSCYSFFNPNKANVVQLDMFYTKNHKKLLFMGKKIETSDFVDFSFNVQY